MKTVFMLTAVLLSLVSCAPYEVPFERMSDDELIAYNMSADPMNQVFCVRERRAGSNIPKKFCATMYELQNEAGEQISRLNAANAGDLGLSRD